MTERNWVLFEEGKNGGGLTVRITNAGRIVFNARAAETLGSARAVALLYDDGSNAIAVRPVEDGDPTASYKLTKIGTNRTQCLVTARRFLRHIGLDGRPDRTYPAEWTDGMLVVELGA